jgi:hypothetical protein
MKTENIWPPANAITENTHANFALMIDMLGVYWGGFNKSQ